MKRSLHFTVLALLAVLTFAATSASAQIKVEPSEGEPTNAKEAAAQKAREAAELEAKYQAWVETLTPAQQEWERVLQAELGGFYLPIHQREKVAGKSNAWDFVEDDPALPRVLLIGDSVSRAYTQTVRKELAGRANVHRAPANCGPTATGLKKIDIWLGDGKWDVIHFNFGIHDRNTPIADYTQRLEQLVERMKQTGATLIWANTTPVPDVPGKYTAASIVERNAAAAVVMTKHGIPIDDLFAAITPRLAELQNPNDVHFSGPGNEFLGKQVAQFLATRLLATAGPATGLLAEEKPVSILAARIGGHVHPSICQTRDGTLVVVYKGANVLMVSRSTDSGDTWSEPEPIATSAIRPDVIRKVEKFEVYPGTVDVLPDDRVLVTWNYIADDKARDGYYERALLYTMSSDGGRTWSEQQLIGPIDGKHLGAIRHNVLSWTEDRWLLPLRVGPPRLFDPSTGELTVFPVVGPDGEPHEFQQIVRTTKGTLLAMGPVLLHSADEGKTWSQIEDFPAVPDKRDNAEGRFLTTLTDGRVLATWGIGHDNKGLRYNLSLDDGRIWDKYRTVILLPEMGIAARYYSGRTVQLDGDHVGTVFMNPEGVHFLKVRLDRLINTISGAVGKEADHAPALPSTGTGADKGLAGEVTIIRDTFGVPHIYAPTDAGVVFGAAWAQAEDNWWQVEDNFIHALGRASELDGEESFLSDYLVRALEIRRLSIEEYRHAPDSLRALYDAYAEGFNHWLERHPEVERRLLEKVEPWHTLALIRFKYHHNEFIGSAGLRQRGTELLLERPDYGMAGEAPTGSNQMALSGSRTASGHPMLLINPHVPFFGRGQYWEVHLISDEGLVFSGLSRFGFMLPYMGNNEALGWAYTDNYSDIGDLYQERFDDPEHPLRYRYGDGWREATEWSETISVLSEGKLQPRKVRLRRTHHGPVLGAVETEGSDPVPVAVRLARLEEGGWFEQWYRMMRARSLDQFKSALAMLKVSYMNTLYADREGNIFYVYSAAIPRRSENYEWRLPVDGSDPGTEWQGYHTLEELPQVLNPESGFLQNCNSTPLQATTELNLRRDDFPAYLIGRETQNPRAVSATRILSRLSDVTLDEFAEAVLDSHLVAAETMLPELLAEFDRLQADDAARARKLSDALTLLRRWDHEATLNSKAATLFVRWAESLDRNARAAQWPHIVALEKAMAALEKDWGTWRVAWGEVNRAQRPDAGGRIPFSDDLASMAIPGGPGWLGSVFTYSSRQGPDTRRRYGTHGNSFVKVIEFAPNSAPEARSIMVFGQSGDPDSRHYLDQVEIYAAKRFKPAWWRREDVEAHAERTDHLIPD